MKFINWVIGVEEKEEKGNGMEDEGKDGEGDNGDENEEEIEDDQKNDRVTFLMKQLNIIPGEVRSLYANVMRAYPTSPLFLMLGLGSVVTNVTRYSAVRRKSAHRTNFIRTGCFYKFLAPSRFGKGIAMSFVGKLGGYLEGIRCAEHEKYIALKQGLVANNDSVSANRVRQECQVDRPKVVFLTGANVLQTQATAAMNGGCGLIAVNEIKSGKVRYTDLDGSYGSMLDFADPDVAARSYRKAEFIPKIKKCRIQLIAAGVKEDWTDFMAKSGRFSGIMARIIPILGYDRDIVRLTYERLRPYQFSLSGLKQVLGIMEGYFQHFSVSDATPSVTLQFSPSALDTEFRETNELLVADFKNDNDVDYEGQYTTLLHHAPPGSTALQGEGSGCGLLSVFLEKSAAEFSPLVNNDADETFLRGLDNVLKIASDFYWAYKIPSYLSSNGTLEEDMETKLNEDMKQIIEEQVITIPNHIVPPLLNLMTYILKGTFLLNRMGKGKPMNTVATHASTRGSRKRYRIVRCLSDGMGVRKKRRYFMSKLQRALRGMTREEILQEVRLLKSHAVVDQPSNGAVALEREFSVEALEYLKSSCEYSTDAAIAQIVQANDQLID